MQITRIYTGPDGESHFEDVEIQLEDVELPGVGAVGRISQRWAATGVLFRETDGDYDLGFHNAPRRQFVINLSGSVELETGLGDKRVLGPGDILLAEDTTGRGHKSRAVGHGTRRSLFVPLEG